MSSFHDYKGKLRRNSSNREGAHDFEPDPDYNPSEWGEDWCPQCQSPMYWQNNMWLCSHCGWKGPEHWNQTPEEPSEMQHPDPWMDNEPGSLTLPEHWGSWHLADEHQGYSNYDTFQVAATYDNDRQLYNQVRQLIRGGGTPQQLEAWATQTVVAPINQHHLQDAQEWNATPEDERVDPNYESFKGTLGDAIEPDREDMDPSNHMITPALVNWQELWADLREELGMDAQPGFDTLPEHWGGVSEAQRLARLSGMDDPTPDPAFDQERAQMPEQKAQDRQNIIDGLEAIRPEMEMMMRTRGMGEPDWAPLEHVIPPSHLGDWMFMGYGQNGQREYKHSGTRRYLNLTPAEEIPQQAKFDNYTRAHLYNRRYVPHLRFQGSDQYQPVDMNYALGHAYQGAEETGNLPNPYPQGFPSSEWEHMEVPPWERPPYPQQQPGPSDIDPYADQR